jgi:tripartite-type tricarboxylate transporter receptor subunit TctC
VTLKTWQGVGAPAGTPRTIIDKIAAEIQKLVGMPETREKLDAEGFVPFYNNPETTAELLNADIVRFAKIIKDGNIKVE